MRKRQRNRKIDKYSMFEELYKDICEHEDALNEYINRYQLTEKKAKINRTCMAISEILKKEDSKLSEMGVYRLIKIREKSTEYYEKVQNGELKINEAYDICFNVKKRKHSGPEDLTLEKCYLLLSDIENEILRRKDMRDTLGTYSEQFKLSKQLKKIKSKIKELSA